MAREKALRFPPILDWLSYRAATIPAHSALVAEGRTWTYESLNAAVDHTVRLLKARGVGVGDRVATLLHNGAGPVLLAHAALRMGFTLVPLNVRLRAAELEWQVSDVNPRLLIADRRTREVADDLSTDSRGTVVVSIDELMTAPDARADAVDHSQGSAPIDAERALAIIYTSGTTGRPKGAMLTVGNFWWSAAGSALNLPPTADDRWLACLPLFHVGGLSIVMRAAIYGITAVVHDGFDADAVNRAIDEEGVTIVSGVAVMLQRMLDARGDRPYPDSLNTILAGGGAVPRRLLEHAVSLGIPVAQTYGLTETTSQAATLSPAEALRKLGSAGRALYPNEIRIWKDDGDVEPGEAGEILVRGPIVMAGYAGNPEATRHAIVDEWLYTGDIGYLDEEGYLYVLDRRHDLIVTGGENVYPAEVEAVLLQFPGVAEAGVIGVVDAEWGKRIVAIVRLDDDAGPNVSNALREHCRARLAGYKVPSEIRVVEEPLPRTASGKLQRSALRARDEPRT